MKNFTLTLVYTLVATFIFAQAPPQKVNYQAVARDLVGTPLVSTPVSVQFEILQGSSSGAAVYGETHSSTTNQFGLFTLEIGGGTPNNPFVIADFANINWGANIYYLQVSVNGDVMPASQLLSVPYALHAGTATSGTAGTNGINCWDTNGNGIQDLSEDINSDGFWDALDCVGDSGLGISWLGPLASNPASPNSNDAYYNSVDGVSYIYNGTTLAWDTIAAGGSNGGDADWVINGVNMSTDPAVTGNVGIGTTTPNYKLTVNSTDSIITAFNSNSPNFGAITVFNSVPTAPVGMILLAGGDTGLIAVDPVQKVLAINNSIAGGHVAIQGDSSAVLYGQVVGAVGDKIINNADTIFSIPKAGNDIINVNQGTSITDSLYVVGNNVAQAGYVLTNNGFGQAQWQPSAGGSLWNQGTGDIYNTSDSIGIGVANPSALLHVSGGGLTQPIALFEKGGFLSANIDINNTASNGSGINFQNGGTTTSSIVATTNNVLTLSSPFVAVGSGTTGGKLQVGTTSSVGVPTLLLHETSTGFSRIKHTNTVANKHWITEAGISASDASSGYSIGYENGSGTVLPFIVYGDSKVGINNIAAPLASLHVMDIGNPSSNGIASEGFSQGGSIVIARNNFAAPNRGAIASGDEMGRLSFSGYGASAYGNGPQIKAVSTEAFTNAANGSELVFSTVANGSSSNVDALKITNDGTVEVLSNLRVLPGAGTAGDVLTSDISGNATWVTPSPAAVSPWTRTGGAIHQTTLTDNVGIGTSTPLGLLHLTKDGHAVIGVQTFNNVASDGGQISLIKTRGTMALPTRVNNGDRLGKVEFVGQNALGTLTSAASILGVADEDFINSTGNGGHLEFHTADLGAGTNEIMRITGAGNVGIGTTNPIELVHLYKTNDTPFLLIESDGSYDSKLITANGTSSAWAMGIDNSISDNFSISYDTDRDPSLSAPSFVINTSGNVGIGTTSPGAKLVVDNTTGDTGIESTSTSTGTSNVAGKFSASSGTSTNTALNASAIASGSSLATGIYSTVSGTTSGVTYGVYGQNSSSSTGAVYGGYFQTLSNTGSITYGVRSDVTSTSSNSQYGLATFMSLTSAGTKYGVYSSVTGGATNWSGYFLSGDVYVADNLAIGITSPTAITHINMVSPATTALKVTNGNITSNNAAVVQFDANSTLTNAFRLERDGQIGIGTASPAAKLDVIGNVKITDGTEGTGKVLVSVDNNGTAQWKTNRVAFHIGGGNGSNTSTQNLAQSTNEKLQFPSFSHTHNTGAYSTTNHEFQAPVAGVYHFSATVTIGGPTNGHFDIDIMHSTGASLAQSGGFIGTEQIAQASRTVSTTVHLNAGESVWVEYYSAFAVASLFGERSSFSGYLIYED